MKYISFILLAFTLYACGESPSNKIEVFYRSRNMTTSNRLSCIELETLYSDDFKKMVYSDDSLIQNVITHTDRLRKTEQDGRIDARAIVLIHRKEKVDTLCIGGYFGVVLNRQKMNDDPELVKLIWSEIEAVDESVLN